MRKFIVIISMLFFSAIAYAQDKTQITDTDYSNSEVPMADKFREDGKIYVLTGVVLIILVGTLTYLVVIDKKVSKLEKSINKES